MEGVGHSVEGALGDLIKEIEPAVKPILDLQMDLDDAMHKAVDAMVWFTMSRILERSPAMAAAVSKGELLLKGAVYSLQTGEITILEEEG